MADVEVTPSADLDGQIDGIDASEDSKKDFIRQGKESLALTPFGAEASDDAGDSRESFGKCNEDEEETMDEPDDVSTVGLKRKLAFDEDEARSKLVALTPNAAVDSEKDAVPDRPRTSRTTATKVSNSLIQKIMSNQSGWDLKITGLMTYDQLAQLTEALANNESTSRLDLEGCAIGDQGCILIRDLLVNSNRIKHVDLQMNQITDIGCKTLAESLPENLGLQRLYLGYNNIRDDGVLALLGAIHPGRQLEIVVSGNTLVSEQVLQKLDKAFNNPWGIEYPARKSASQSGRVSKGSAEQGRATRSSKEESSRFKERDDGTDSDSQNVTTRRSRGEGKNKARTFRAGGRDDRAQEEGGGSKGGGWDDGVQEMVQEVYRGMPISYSFSESAAASINASSSQLDNRDTFSIERARLAARFKLQWARVKQSLADQLEAECRGLSIMPKRKTMFESTCRILLAQRMLPSAWPKRPDYPEEEWMGSEEDRRCTVEESVKALMVKFRQSIEDVTREQRYESQALAAMHGTLSGTKRELPAGCAADPGVVYVPCPFRLDVTVNCNEQSENSTYSI